MPVDTSKVKEHRALRFATIDQLLTEIDSIEAADTEGRLKRVGNWTTGQVFGHLATWINYGWEGYPMKVPWFIRLILKFKVRAYLRDGMPQGVKIPNTADGTFGTEVLTTQEGARRLRAALRRLQKGEPARFHSPAFGPLSDADRIQLNLRHAELHLGYLVPG
ncbi:hypothetical protein RAS1_27980 [Phycisphaerae bacterium RAS1]|nr:hypothetical protein RAS1_27980 [Phycisphaerae bacterium RAS1]